MIILLLLLPPLFSWLMTPIPSLLFTVLNWLRVDLLGVIKYGGHLWTIGRIDGINNNNFGLRQCSNSEGWVIEVKRWMVVHADICLIWLYNSFYSNNQATLRPNIAINFFSTLNRMIFALNSTKLSVEIRECMKDNFLFDLISIKIAWR